MMDIGEDIGLATVYRVLTQFEAAGLVRRHHFEGGHAVFELERGHHHDHMVCLKCGYVVEFEDDVIEKRQRSRAEELGFRLTEHSLIMYGECLRENCPNIRVGTRKPCRREGTMRHPVLLAAGVALAASGLARAEDTPAQDVKEGAHEVGHGVKEAATGVGHGVKQ